MRGIRPVRGKGSAPWVGSVTPMQSTYDEAAVILRDELLHTSIPRRFKDLLQRMLALCAAGLSLPQDYRDQYMQFLAYKQRQDKYGK